MLTHALHYGTSVFEGVRAYETPDGGTGVFRHQDHIDRLFRSAGALPHGDPVLQGRDPRPRRSRRSPRNGLKSCYIRPLVFRGAGPMGLYPLDCPVDVIIAVWEWGAYLGDEGKLNGVRAKVSCWRRISDRRADPDGQGRRPVPELDPGQDRGRQGRLRGGDPARLARLRLRGHGREPVPGQGRQGRHARLRQRHPRGHQPRGGDRDPARPGLRGRRARHRARRALPRRRDLHDRHRGRADADPRGRRPTRSATARAARSRPRSRRSSRTRCTGARSATRTGWTGCPRAVS